MPHPCHSAAIGFRATKYVSVDFRTNDQKHAAFVGACFREGCLLNRRNRAEAFPAFNVLDADQGGIESTTDSSIKPHCRQIPDTGSPALR
jgi:hypothetical protein